jgi:hypothetical protein
VCQGQVTQPTMGGSVLVSPEISSLSFAQSPAALPTQRAALPRPACREPVCRERGAIPRTGSPRSISGLRPRTVQSHGGSAIPTHDHADRAGFDAGRWACPSSSAPDGCPTWAQAPRALPHRRPRGCRDGAASPSIRAGATRPWARAAERRAQTAAAAGAAGAAAAIVQTACPACPARAARAYLRCAHFAETTTSSIKTSSFFSAPSQRKRTFTFAVPGSETCRSFA